MILLLWLFPISNHSTPRMSHKMDVQIFLHVPRQQASQSHVIMSSFSFSIFGSMRFADGRTRGGGRCGAFACGLAVLFARSSASGFGGFPVGSDPKKCSHIRCTPGFWSVI